MSNKPVFGYWKLRGLGQPIRHLLHYLEINYEEKFYSTGELPNANIDEWLKDKFNLGLQFPNVPYWIEEDAGVKLSESRAILKHLAREYGPNLLPTTSAENRDVDVIEYFSLDLHQSLIRLVYGYTDKGAEELDENTKVKFGYLSKFLEGKKFVLGNKVSYVDFSLYEVLYHYKAYKVALVEAFPNLVAYMKSFEAVPQIAKYMATPGYMKGPCFSVFADLKI